MNSLFPFYPGDRVPLLIAEILLQVTAVIAAASLASKFFFARNAAARHNLWFWALLLVLFSPATAYLTDAAGFCLVSVALPEKMASALAATSAVASETAGSDDFRATEASRAVAEMMPAIDLAQRNEPDNVETVLPVVQNGEAETDYFERENSRNARALQDTPAAWKGASLAEKAAPADSHSLVGAKALRAAVVAALFVWLLGAIVLLTRLVRRGFALRRLSAAAVPWEEDKKRELLRADLRRVFAVENLPPILLWNDPRLRLSPILVGLRHPAIVLSRHLVEEMSRDELRDVLVHECAHVVRRDTLVGLIQRAADVLFWPYPLVRWMNRQLARAREEVCDNYVLGQSDGARYAQTLFDLSERIDTLSPGLAHVGLFQYRWSLEQRVAGLLDARRTVMTRIRPLSMIVLAALFIGVAVSAAGLKAQGPIASLPAKNPTASTPQKESMSPQESVSPQESTIAAPQETVTLTPEKKEPLKTQAEQGKPDDSAATARRYEVNKKVKDFPDKTDLSTPEAACAAIYRIFESKEMRGLSDYAWTKFDDDLKDIENTLKKDPNLSEHYSSDVLNAAILEVGVYRDDLATVVVGEATLAAEEYKVLLFGRINGIWKVMDLIDDSQAFSMNRNQLRQFFEKEKENLWKQFLVIRQKESEKNVSSRNSAQSQGEKPTPQQYAAIKTSTPKAEKLLLMGLVENFFLTNARDITARKSIAWGDVEKNPDGSRSIRYQFEARIWDKETMLGDDQFTFDKDNVMVRYEHLTPPKKKETPVVDTKTQKGVIALVEDFFSHNFRDITSRDPLEWSDIEKDKDGNVSIRHKYRARIWDRETKIMNQIFTFDKNGDYVKFTNVEGYPRDEEPAKKIEPVEIKERTYEVHKKIADYPDKEDMSTPENAYASIEHAWINEGNAFWPRLSVPKKITRLTEEKPSPMPAEQAKLVLESEIIEVRIWNDTHAAVVAKRKDLRSAGPFDIRYLECIEGRWLNDGNDVCDTLEHARERIVQSEKLWAKTKEFSQRNADK